MRIRRAAWPLLISAIVVGILALVVAPIVFVTNKAPATFPAWFAATGVGM